MKILHTSDWHVGKMLRGASRLDEHRAVLAEIVGIAAAEAVDLVLVAGDLFDSAAPPPEAQQVVWEALLALRATGAAVVAIGGNHDNQSPLDALRAGVRRGRDHAARPRDPARARRRHRRSTANGEAATRRALPFVSQRYAVRAEQMFELTPPRRPALRRAHAAAHRRARGRLPPGHGQPRRRALLRARRHARRRRARRADDLRLRHRGAALPDERALRRARAPAPHATHARARARVVRGLTDPGRLRRGAGHEARARRRSRAPASLRRSRCAS